MTTPNLLEVSGVLRRHAKSFSFAGMFLPTSSLKKAEMVYAFCRWVDDVADESASAVQAQEELQTISDELRGIAPARFFLREFRSAAASIDLDLEIPDFLIKGVLSDLGRVDFRSEAELHQYCYKVASTVGLMMCSVLGVKNPAALPFAIDLGIAMQLTNIARDVREDREKNRNYLPFAHLSDEQRIEWVLEEADIYYQSGFQGLRYIPWRARFAICVAAVVYRAIGEKIRANGFDFRQGRVFVPFGQKLWFVISRALPLFLKTIGPGIDSHQVHLHRHLVGYPYVR